MANSACVLCGEPWDTDHIRHEEPMYVQGLYFAGRGCPCCTGKRQRKKSVEKLLHVGHHLMREEGENQDRLEMLADGRDQLDYRNEWDDAQKPLVLKECEGCDTKAEFDQDDLRGIWNEKEEKLEPGITVWTSPRFGIGERELVRLEDLIEGTIAHGVMHDLTYFDDDWSFETVHDKVLCQKCWTTCDGQTAEQYERKLDESTGRMVPVLVEDSVKDCEAKLFTGDAHSVFVSDTYDPGSSFFVQDLGSWGKTFCSDCYERLPHCGHCGEHWDFDDDSAEFVEDDEYRCTGCTSYVRCDACNEWAETVNEDGYGIECCAVPDAPDSEQDEPQIWLKAEELEPMYGDHVGSHGGRIVCEQPGCENLATKRITNVESYYAPVFSCDEHEVEVGKRVGPKEEADGEGSG